MVVDPAKLVQSVPKVTSPWFMNWNHDWRDPNWLTLRKGDATRQTVRYRHDRWMHRTMDSLRGIWWYIIICIIMIDDDIDSTFCEISDWKFRHERRSEVSRGTDPGRWNGSCASACVGFPVVFICFSTIPPNNWGGSHGEARTLRVFLGAPAI